MRILILTAIPFWHPGTNELIEELRTKGIRVDALDILPRRLCEAVSEPHILQWSFILKLYFVIVIRLINCCERVCVIFQIIF